MTPRFGKGSEGPPPGWDKEPKESSEEFKDSKIEVGPEGGKESEKDQLIKNRSKDGTEFAHEYYRRKELRYKRGENVHIEASFCRHEEPGKTPEGMSADFLTEQGIQKAIARGKETPHKYILAVGSKSVERARQTGALELESAVDNPEGMAKAVNVKMTESLEKAGHKKFGAKGEYLIYRHSDLNPVKGLKDMWLEGGKKAQEAVESGEISADQKEIRQYDYYLNNEERARELGAQTAREVAKGMAHPVWQQLRMSERLYEGLDLNSRYYSHGPRLEALLKFVLRRPHKATFREPYGKIGFDSVSEIGGPFKPGERFDLDIQRNERGELMPVKILRGEKELGVLDLEALAQLVEEYKQNKEKK